MVSTVSGMGPLCYLCPNQTNLDQAESILHIALRRRARGLKSQLCLFARFLAEMDNQSGYPVMSLLLLFSSAPSPCNRGNTSLFENKILLQVISREWQ